MDFSGDEVADQFRNPSQVIRRDLCGRCAIRLTSYLAAMVGLRHCAPPLASRCRHQNRADRSVVPAISLPVPHFNDRESSVSVAGRRPGYLPSMGILLCFLTASGVLASSIVSTPLANCAAIFSGSTPTGISMNRSNEPYSRSRR